MDMSIQLKRASKLPQDAVAACKIYGSHISDVLKQFDEITKLFAIENELRAIQCRELLPFPTISPHEERIKSKRDKDKLIHMVDKEIVEVLKIIQSIELKYQKETEAKQKEQQARLARQANRVQHIHSQCQHTHQKHKHAHTDRYKPTATRRGSSNLQTQPCTPPLSHD